MSSSLNKITSNTYPNNPVNVNQIVGLDALTLNCISVDLACGGMNNLLQALIDKVCVVPNFDLGCLTALQSYDSVIQALIDQVCTLSIPTTSTPLDLTGTNLALGDTWDCTQTPAMDAGLTPTSEEVVQAMSSRIIDLTTELTAKCVIIDDLSTRLTQLELTVANINCCP